MRISISNIAWDTDEDEQVASLLNNKGINAIDIAPGKYFSNPTQASNEDILRVKKWWADRGIEIVGMQALLFGTSGLNLFGDEQTRAAMLAHLEGLCRIGEGLGAKKLVFGSPKNRDRAGLSEEESLTVAKSFFRRLGEIAAKYDVFVCLEPNPPVYGANFMTTASETAKVVAMVAHPNIRMQLDTGAVLINGESIDQIVKECLPFIGHIHLSEPNLVTLGDSETNHHKIGQTLQRVLPHFTATIEMLASKTEPHLNTIDRALTIATTHYQGGPQ